MRISARIPLTVSQYRGTLETVKENEMQKLGAQGPKGESPMLRIRVPQDLLEKLEKQATAEKTTVSAIVRRFIEAGVKRG